MNYIKSYLSFSIPLYKEEIVTQPTTSNEFVLAFKKTCKLTWEQNQILKTTATSQEEICSITDNKILYALRNDIPLEFAKQVTTWPQIWALYISLSSDNLSLAEALELDTYIKVNAFKEGAQPELASQFQDWSQIRLLKNNIPITEIIGADYQETNASTVE